MRKVVLLGVLFALLIVVQAGTAEATYYNPSEEEYVTLVFDDVVQEDLDVDPFVYNGRTVVPVRFVTEALGADVAWNQKFDGTVIISTEGEADPEMSGYPGGIDVFFDGEMMNQAKWGSPVIVTNRVLVPVRVIAEEVGAEVDWDADERKVRIWSRERPEL